jgi:long-chain acyl-CoA synthetase
MRKLLGGNIRFFISGGGSLDVQIKKFLSVVFSAPIVEAYGAFETGGFISATSVFDIEGGHVGGVLPCNIMQLRSVDSINVVTN